MDKINNLLKEYHTYREKIIENINDKSQKKHVLSKMKKIREQINKLKTQLYFIRREENKKKLEIIY